MNKGKTTQYAVLGALSIQPMSGYEIKKMMAGSTNYFWTESNGQLYPTLAALTKAKLVTVKNEASGAKTKKTYTLTKAGEKKLQEWLMKDPQYYPNRNELLLKLFYGANVSPLISIKHINNHIKKCETALAIYTDIEKQLEQLVKQRKRSVYYLLTVKAGISTVNAELEWSQEAIKLINKYAPEVNNEKSIFTR